MLVSYSRGRKKNEKVHHGGRNRRLSGPVCRCVAERRSNRKIPKPTQTTAVSAPEVPVMAPKEEPKALPQTEEENTESPQPEPPMETVPEPEATPTATSVAPEIQPTPEPSPTAESTPEPTPAQTVADPQPSNMVYVEGFGWLESQGEDTVIHDDMMYENGNKVGIMGSSE